MSMIVMLETERTVLQRLTRNDVEALSAIYGDPEVRRYFPEGMLDRAQTAEEIDWFIEDSAVRPDLGLWAIIERRSGRFMGRGGLLAWTIEGRGEIEIAYLLGREHWRQGFGREVARALVRHGLDRLRLPRLIALVDPDNVASIRTAESAGLAYERTVDVDGVASLYAIHRTVDDRTG